MIMLGKGYETSPRSQEIWGSAPSRTRSYSVKSVSSFAGLYSLTGSSVEGTSSRAGACPRNPKQ